MARTRPAVIAMAAILVSATFYMAGVSGQAEAPGPAGATLDCTTYIANTSDCLTYVSVGSKLRKPDKYCCPELAGLVDSNPLCLCNLLGGDNGLGLQIDVNRALKLPSLCSLTTPPVSLCSDIGIPVGAPTSMSHGAGSAPAGEVSSSSTSEASSIASKALSLFFSFVVAF